MHCKVYSAHLVGRRRILGLLLTTKFKMLAALEDLLNSVFAFSAFHTKDDLFCRFGFTTKNWFLLATISLLFGIVTTLSLSQERWFTSLVLGHLVEGMLSTFLAWTEGISCFGNIYLSQ